MDGSRANVAPDFKPDGALRDIYVMNATLADWEAALALITREHVSAVFTRGGEPATFPSSAADAFADSANTAVGLSFDVGGIELAWHFFTPAAIEFDFLPEQVNSLERFGALQKFLRALARTLNKTVVLSPEGSPTLAILSVDPTGTLSYHPALDALSGGEIANRSV